MARRTFSAEAKRTLGANLVAQRDKLGWTQGAAAERASVMQPMLSRWEKGKRTPDGDGLLRLAVAYGCTLDDFFGGVDEHYDSIIERRIPIDVERHYQAKIDTFIRRTTAAMQLALEPTAPAPTPATSGAAPRGASGKLTPTRARRAPKRK